MANFKYDTSRDFAATYAENLSKKGLKENKTLYQAGLNKEEYTEVREGVFVHKTATVAPNACLIGPAIIGPNTEIRHCAFVRENVIIGENCVLGNSCEAKNVIIFDNTQVPHFNYVGDSIMGYHSHMGAGSIVSNLKSDGSNVVVRSGEEKQETNLRKFGAIVGDFVEVGCNSVLNPGTVVGRNSNIYPLARVRGQVPANSIYKDEDNVVEKRA
ncbi:MAG: UDP-N-acetylglucosamine pyrophosphorylase [Erysipelotrichaceae bacterium]|nr:UDP-N-acetylglucosamine pyrophosphorylase [Erysipelotrichaceae bacterium]